MPKNEEAKSYTVGSRVQEFAKEKELRVGGEFYDALDKKVQETLAAAADRAKKNGRSTLRPEDL